MSETIQNIETASGVASFIGGIIAKKYGGTMGEAAASYLLGQTTWTASTSDYLAKVQEGRANGEDLADISSDTATTLAGFGVLAEVASPIYLGITGGAGMMLIGYQQLPDAAKQAFWTPIFDGLTGIGNLNEWETHLKELFPFIQTLNDIGHWIGQTAFDLNPELAIQFTAATQPIYYDPLALDLDGDGIETVGLNGYDSVLFDHNADGVKTAGGWVAADDGLLALDLNGNGQIDNGRELFGIDYLKQNGQLAGDGFDALRDLDANADNVFDANDAQFSNVRVWRDLNQDGISQADELYTLAQLNIQSIALNAVQQTVNLGNGNQQTAGAIYTRTDGGTGTAGNLDFSQNSFYRSFADAIDTTGFEALPDMRGAGQVRNLREAAALSPVLAQLITDFAAADRTGQQALLDAILKAWSDTSPMAATFTGAYAGRALTVNMQNLAIGGDAYNAWADKLTILERFNGRTFNTVPDGGAANDKTWRMAA